MGRVKDIDVHVMSIFGKVVMWSTQVTCMILFLSPYVLKSETYGNETKAAVFPMMLLWMYQVMYYPVYQGVDAGGTWYQ